MAPEKTTERISFFSATSGTWLNLLTVAIGTLVGLWLGDTIPDRYPAIIFLSFGLLTLALGIDASVLGFGQTVSDNRDRVLAPETYGARLAMVMVASLALGGVLGVALDLTGKIDWLAQQASQSSEPAAGSIEVAGSTSFARGFLTASVLFCVGALTIIGSLRNGRFGDPGFLQVKSVLDGFSSIALAATYGIGVLLSLVTIVLIQGSLSVLAWRFAEPLPEVSARMMAAVGGVVMLGTGLLILEVKDIPVADMTPAIFLPPAIILVTERVMPGYLLPRKLPANAG